MTKTNSLNENGWKTSGDVYWYRVAGSTSTASDALRNKTVKKMSIYRTLPNSLSKYIPVMHLHSAATQKPAKHYVH